MGFKTRIADNAVAHLAVYPNGRRNKTFHQVTFRRADIRFINGDAVFAQQFLHPHKLAVSTAIQTGDRLTMKVSQLERRQAIVFFRL
ncbi:Uncharacterised protein [Salmonella enterica subsp. enterica serovar Bovismorbificans]|uniref:Uncharacterized protein n=1 Tax=Salmonella enterica subsp. enterica serovar Bovismorbificans TaxID=58097 RepID=A0A655C181_SALET|nr:Uncharacterised protein [Salmonella enterica subsp. enterica serovar Bovismorbificans]